jgi:hypothetical protein
MHKLCYLFHRMRSECYQETARIVSNQYVIRTEHKQKWHRKLKSRPGEVKRARFIKTTETML